MPDFQKLATECSDESLRPIFKIIDDVQSKSGVMDSSSASPIGIDGIQEIQELMLSNIRANITNDGIPPQTLVQAKERAASGIANLVADSFYNSVNGIGTSFDPGYYNTADIPISLSPNEATSYYASGGIPAMIIDTKAGGMLVNGYRFIGNGWKPEWLEKLKDYADSLGFDRVVRDSNRDGLIFGGSMLVPAFKRDNALTYQMGEKQLIKEGILKKGCIDYFWHADRWNCVLIPDYNIAASDYLEPKQIFVPISGVSVNTERGSVIRPRQLPYWGTIRQMGWGVSDMESWIRSLLAYEMCITSIPIMAQQMSVMYSHMPMDALIQAGGANAAKALAAELQKQMTTMSNVAPKTFNTALELKVVERNFTGFPELVSILKQDVGAKAELSDSIIFHTSASGFSDNKEDSTIKEAGSIQKVANRVIPQYQNSVRMMVYSLFGPDSEQAELADHVRLDFDSPIVLTNEERNQAGATFSAVFTAMITGGLQPGDAMEVGKAFIPDIELPQDVIDRLNAEPDLMDETDESNAISSLGERLRGDPIDELGKQVRGEVGVSHMVEKLQGKTGLAGLAEKIASPVKRLFSRIKE
jgi:hypothetical protein